MKKQHILAEIKRTAGANGGVPLGRLRFRTETGIKESDWRGIYWVRRSEAIREAGFVPNKRTTAHDQSKVLARFVEFVRELERFPVWGEVRLKRRSDRTFPSEMAFRRFGNKAALVSKVIDYCRGFPGHEDVIALCESAPDGDAARTIERPDKEPEFGFVYLLKSGRHYKVGKTNAAGRRERELAIQLPERAKTVHVIRTDDPAGIEAYWHRRFESKRLNGEWFALDGTDIAAFSRRKFM